VVEHGQLGRLNGHGSLVVHPPTTHRNCFEQQAEQWLPIPGRDRGQTANGVNYVRFQAAVR